MATGATRTRGTTRPPARRAPSEMPVPSAHLVERRSRRRPITVLCLFGLIVIGGVGVAFVLAPLGAAIAAVALAALVASSLLGDPERLQRELGGRLVDPVREARLVNVVEGLCVANGLTVPELRILDDPAPNSLTLGRSARAATLFCTTGLLVQLDRMELEGLVAHELAHMRCRDLEVSCLATRLLGLLAAVSEVAGRIGSTMAGADREVQADLEATAMTRYPPGLLAALEKLQAASSTRPRGLSPRLARLTSFAWCVPLVEAEHRAPVAGGLDLDLRIAALRER